MTSFNFNDNQQTIGAIPFIGIHLKEIITQIWKENVHQKIVLNN